MSAGAPSPPQLSVDVDQESRSAPPTFVAPPLSPRPVRPPAPAGLPPKSPLLKNHSRFRTSPRDGKLAGNAAPAGTMSLLAVDTASSSQVKEEGTRRLRKLEVAIPSESEEEEEDNEKEDPRNSRRSSLVERCEQSMHFGAELAHSEQSLTALSTLSLPRLASSATSPCALPSHKKQFSDDAITNFSCSQSSVFLPRYSLLSIDNSCFDLQASSQTHSLVGTPVEKMFPKDPLAALLTKRGSCVEFHVGSDSPMSAGSEEEGKPALPLTEPISSSESDGDVAGASHTRLTKAVENKREDVKVEAREKDNDENKAAIVLAPAPKPAAPSLIPGDKEKEKEKEKRQPLSVNPLKADLPVRPPRRKDSLRLSSSSTTDPVPAIPMVTKKEKLIRKNTLGRRLGQLRVIDILRVKIIQVKGLRGNSTKPIFILAKLDNKDVYQSAAIARNSTEPVIDEFSKDATGRFGQLHLVVLEGGKNPRPIGRVSVGRKEIVRHSGSPHSFPLRVVSKWSDVQGQICLDIRRKDATFSVRVIDYCDLGLKEPQELYLLVSAAENSEPKKLKINPGRFSEEWLEMECPSTGTLSVKMSLWHDLLRGLNSVFHGQIRVDVDERWTDAPSKWFYLRPRHLDGDKKEKKEKEDKAKESLGEVKLLLSYQADHVLPIDTYKPLLTVLSQSCLVNPFQASLVSLLENLPKVDLGNISRPLVQIFAHSKEIRPLLRLLYLSDIAKCQDPNTLFRSQSLASKMLYELMKLYAHQYLLVTLKPVIDKIYAERKTCEIDPARLTSPDQLEKNTTVLLSYFSLTFSRVVESSSRCPHALRQIFADLRKIVGAQTGRADSERLALSSFLIMRFFAAAILNPKFFGLKRDQPDSRVSRTLVLLSKILQRLANSVVSEQALSTKEPWLEPILQRVCDEPHKHAMKRFLDKISLQQAEPSQSAESISVIRDGYLTETRHRDRRTWKKMMTSRKRFVTLTEHELCWQKSHRGDFSPKGSIALCEIESVACEGKATLVVRSPRLLVAFEAASAIEMNDWISSIERQRARARRLSTKAELAELCDTDVERELESVHILLVEHADTLAIWKNCLEGGVEVPEGTPPLPKTMTFEDDEAGAKKKVLMDTLDTVLAVTYSIETAHREAIALYTTQMENGSGTRENPIGDDNYLLLKRKLNLP